MFQGFGGRESDRLQPNKYVEFASNRPSWLKRLLVMRGGMVWLTRCATFMLTQRGIDGNVEASCTMQPRDRKEACAAQLRKHPQPMAAANVSLTEYRRWSW
eukprot:2437-Chlamydomonas_euryale.AAC.2